MQRSSSTILLTQRSQRGSVAYESLWVQRAPFCDTGPGQSNPRFVARPPEFAHTRRPPTGSHPCSGLQSDPSHRLFTMSDETKSVGRHPGSACSHRAPVRCPESAFFLSGSPHHETGSYAVTPPFDPSSGGGRDSDRPMRNLLVGSSPCRSSLYRCGAIQVISSRCGARHPTSEGKRLHRTGFRGRMALSWALALALASGIRH